MTDTGAQTMDHADAVVQTAEKSYSVDPNEPLVYHDFDYVGYKNSVDTISHVD